MAILTQKRLHFGLPEARTKTMIHFPLKGNAFCGKILGNEYGLMVVSRNICIGRRYFYWINETLQTSIVTIHLSIFTHRSLSVSSARSSILYRMSLLFSWQSVSFPPYRLLFPSPIPPRESNAEMARFSPINGVEDRFPRPIPEYFLIIIYLSMARVEWGPIFG